MFSKTPSRPCTRRAAAALCLSLALLLASAPPAAGCSWDYLIWIPRARDADALYRFVRDGKAGFIDRSGKVVIEPKFRVYGNYDDAFREGLLEVDFMPSRYVDREGKDVVPAPYRGEKFAEGLAAVLDDETRRWGYVNREGKYVISPRFESCKGCFAALFSEGLARVRTGDRLGFIDRSGEFAVRPTLLHAEDFSDGMARVIVEGPCTFYSPGPCPSEANIIGGAAAEAPPCRFTFVNWRGSVLAQRFDGARDFSEGLAPVRQGRKWGYIDKTGRLVIEPRFDEAASFFEGRALVKQGDVYGFIDERGEYAVEPSFKYAEDFSDGLAPAGDLNWQGPAGLRYIDRNGHTVIPGPFRVASRFFKGLAHVQLETLEEERDGRRWRTRRYAYIDTKGRTVFAYEYETEG
jgi:hypothetical protein